MNTIFGVKWPIITPTQIAILLFIFLLVATILIVLRIIDFRKSKEHHFYQIFLFKAKQRGLSNFQTRILYNLIKRIKLKDKSAIFNDYHLFENSLGIFLAFLKKQDEKTNSLYAISKELIKIHEKLYHPIIYKKPIKVITDIDNNLLLSFLTENNHVYIGRIITVIPNKIILRLFRKSRQLTHLVHKLITAYLFRIGDAEYTFSAVVSKVEKDTIEISISDNITRGKEVRYPFINTLIPCEVMNPDDETIRMKGTILKLNTSGVIIRTRSKLSYSDNHSINFTIEDFKIVIPVVLIGNNTAPELQINYYTLKFTEISEIAMKILNEFIIEHYN